MSDSWCAALHDRYFNLHSEEQREWLSAVNDENLLQKWMKSSERVAVSPFLNSWSVRSSRRVSMDGGYRDLCR